MAVPTAVLVAATVYFGLGHVLQRRLGRGGGGPADGSLALMPAPEHAIAAALLVPLGGAGLIALAGRAPNLRETITLVTAAALLACVLTLLPAVAAGARPGFVAVTVLPGLAIAFEVEPLGMLFALVASGAVDRQLVLLDRLHARQPRGAPDALLRLLRARPLRRRWGSLSPATCSRCSSSTSCSRSSTYPLVAHKGSAEARSGGRIYLGYADRHVDRASCCPRSSSLALARHDSTSSPAASSPASSRRVR